MSDKQKQVQSIRFWLGLAMIAAEVNAHLTTQDWLKNVPRPKPKNESEAHEGSE